MSFINMRDLRLTDTADRRSSTSKNAFLLSFMKVFKSISFFVFVSISKQHLHSSLNFLTLSKSLLSLSLLTQNQLTATEFGYARHNFIVIGHLCSFFFLLYNNTTTHTQKLRGVRHFWFASFFVWFLGPAGPYAGQVFGFFCVVFLLICRNTISEKCMRTEQMTHDYPGKCGLPKHFLIFSGSCLD